MNLPDKNELIKKCKSLALLDVIVMPDWEYRYFSFNCLWDTANSEMMASMRNGEGAEYFILFTETGVVGKVFDSKNIIDFEDALNAISNDYSTFKNEPAFNLKKMSVCFWLDSNLLEWNFYPKAWEDIEYFNFLIEGFDYYHVWAERYYEKEIDYEVGKQIFETHLVSSESVRIINNEISIEDIEEDIQETLG